MAGLLGLGGWLLAGLGIGTAVVTWVRFARHTEAVARACHEVRGPLTAIRLGLELRQLSHTRLRGIELELGRATVALDDLAAARADPAARRLESVDVSELVVSSVEAWRAVAAARGARIELQAAGRSLLVVGERLRLAQAIGNLLANAIEHGGGTVHVALRGTPGTVRIEVEDAGPGLPVPIDELVRRRTRPRRSARGHGLSIVTRIATAHGGRLASGPGDRGARMVLELPAAKDAGPAVRH